MVEDGQLHSWSWDRAFWAGVLVAADPAAAMFEAAAGGGEVGVQKFSHAVRGFSQVNSVFELADQQDWQPTDSFLGTSELF